MELTSAIPSGSASAILSLRPPSLYQKYSINMETNSSTTQVFLKGIVKSKCINILSKIKWKASEQKLNNKPNHQNTVNTKQLRVLQKKLVLTSSF